MAELQRIFSAARGRFAAGGRLPPGADHGSCWIVQRAMIDRNADIPETSTFAFELGSTLAT